MLSAGGANWSKPPPIARRSAALDEERADIDECAAAARREIVEYYEQKGLDPDLATRVVDQLMIRSPLKAALEYEHGILEVTSRAEVLYTGVFSSLAYALGAAVPFVLTLYLPVDIEAWVIFLSVLVALVLTSLVGAPRRGRERAEDDPAHAGGRRADHLGQLPIRRSGVLSSSPTRGGDHAKHDGAARSANPDLGVEIL